jgi:hypothetical protein
VDSDHGSFFVIATTYSIYAVRCRNTGMLGNSALKLMRDVAGREAKEWKLRQVIWVGVSHLGTKLGNQPFGWLVAPPSFFFITSKALPPHHITLFHFVLVSYVKINAMKLLLLIAYRATGSYNIRP